MSQPENMTLQATLNSRKPKSTTADIRQRLEWPGRICILLAVVVTPWLYGGVYFSAQFLMAMCCLVGIGFLWFESGVSERRSLVLPYLLVPLFIGICMAFVQMAHLGEATSGILGKQKELYPLLTGEASTPLSISMSRSDTWDEIGLLAIAFASLILGCRYFRSTAYIKLLLIALTVLGVTISLFGIIQSLTSEPYTIFWNVPLLGGGTPFGPYVNRNNAAGYLLICMGASLGLITITFTRERRGPKPMGTKDLPFWTQFKNHSLRFIAELNAPRIATLLASLAIALGIISSLSRGGVLSLLLASGATVLLYGMARRPSFSAFIFLPAAIVAVMISFWLPFGDQLMQRMEMIDTVEVTSTEDMRIEHWRDTWPATREFGLFGSGIGSYDEVHRIYNKGKQQVVYRYAENQYYQALVELGWPGLILLLSAWALSLYYSLLMLFKGVSASTIGIGVASLFVTVGVGVASFFDYGLYMPANMLLMSLFCGFVAYHAQSFSSRLKKKTWISKETPNSVAQFLLLILFAALAMFALDLYRKWQIQSVVRGEFPHRTFNWDSPDLTETDELIVKLAPMVKQTRNSEGVDYLARLFIHRMRLELFEVLEQGISVDDDKERVWQRTSLDMIQENAWAMYQNGEMFSSVEFLNSEFIRNNLKEARKYLVESRRIDPMEAQTHLMLGQVNALIGTKSVASTDMERAALLAPNRIDFKYLTGFYYLQTDRTKEAARHLRELLEYAPQQFGRVMRIIFGGSNRSVSAIDELTVARDIIPDDPSLLYKLATQYLSSGSPAKSLALNRADALLTGPVLSDLKMLLIKAEVKYEKKEYADCIELFESYLNARPHIYKVQYRVARIQLMLKDFDAAEEKLRDILRMADDPSLKQKALKLRDQLDEERKTNGDPEIR